MRTTKLGQSRREQKRHHPTPGQDDPEETITQDRRDARMIPQDKRGRKMMVWKLERTKAILQTWLALVFSKIRKELSALETFLGPRFTFPVLQPFPWVSRSCSTFGPAVAKGTNPSAFLNLVTGSKTSFPSWFRCIGVSFPPSPQTVNQQRISFHREFSARTN
jgi:hypothetical protein